MRFYKTVLTAITVLAIGFVSGGGCNLYTEVSNETSDAALIDTATNQINAGQWTAAINTLNSLTPATLATRSVQDLLASAYAGRGGLNVINLIDNLNSNASSGSSTLFQFLLQAFVGSSISNFNDEVTAQNTITAIADVASNRTPDENIFLMFVEFAKLGTLFAAIADLNQDGTVDATFNNCDHTTVTDAEAAEVVIAVSIILQSLAATGSQIAGTSLSTVTAACTTIAGVNASFCDTVDIGSVTTSQRAVARTLVGEANLNVGLKATPSLATYQFTSPPAGAPVLCP